jgi:hypothetical protein
MDVCGPLPQETLGGARYFATFVDDHTRYSEVRFLKKKSDVAAEAKAVFRKLENQTGLRIKKVKSDNGGEYVNTELKEFYAGAGIIHQRTPPYTPQHNGVAERLNRTLLEKERAMRIAANLPKSTWGESLATANYLRNISPASGQERTPWELFHGKKPDVSHLRVYGSRVYVKKESSQVTKLEDRSEKGCLVGYDVEDGKAYRILLKGMNKVVRVPNQNVVFDESYSLKSATKETHQDKGNVKIVDKPELMEHEVELDEVIINEEATGEEHPEELGPGSEEPDEVGNHGVADGGIDGFQTVAGWRSTRERREPSRLCAANCAVKLIPIPKSHAEAIASDQAALWKEAMEDEMTSLVAHGTWELEEAPCHTKVIKCGWVYSLKLNEAGEVARFKARLVAKGWSQRPGVDFLESFAPVAANVTLLTLLGTVATDDLHLRQLDVKTAFLNGRLEEEVWMEQPPGFQVGGRRLKCRLVRSLYGLKQAPRAWHQRLTEVLAELGFQPGTGDMSLFVREGKFGRVLLLVYVDDALVAAAEQADIIAVVADLRKHFQIRDMGDAKMFLGKEIIRDREAQRLTITQEKFTQGLLERFQMSTANARRTPMNAGMNLRSKQVDGEGLDSEQEHKYAELVGRLLYLAGSTRPDIGYAVSVLSRFMAAPTKAHWEGIKGVMRYLVGTCHYGITFGPNTAVKVFGDSDFAADVETRRSRTGFLITKDGGAIAWSSRLQPTVATSTSEAEYMAAGQATREALGIKKIIQDVTGKRIGAVEIYCDNTGAVSLAKGTVGSSRVKHIDVQHHFVKERQLRGDVKIINCSSSDQMADFLTKVVSMDAFQKCCAAAGLLGR